MGKQQIIKIIVSGVEYNTDNYILNGVQLVISHILYDDFNTSTGKYALYDMSDVTFMTNIV